MLNNHHTFYRLKTVFTTVIALLSGMINLNAEFEANVIPPGAGHLVIVGGGDNQAWDEIFSTIVSLRLEDRPLAVFGTAQPVDNARKAGETLVQRLNATFGENTAIYVHITSEDGAEDLSNVEVILQSGGVFFIGGNQRRIMKGFTHSDGSPTLALRAIWALYAEGACIAGSSAGAAIMSHPMISGGTSSNALLHGPTPSGASVAGVHYMAGMGFNSDAVFCQYNTERGRFGRLLAAVASPVFHSKLGIGIAEGTALVVDNNTGVGTVIGAKGIFVIDAYNVKWLDHGQMAGVKVHYLDRGDQINLRSREIFIAKERFPVSPSQPEQKLFVDAWENDAIYDLMVRILDTQNVSSGIARDSNFDLVFNSTPDSRLLRKANETGGIRPTGSVTDLSLNILRRHDEASPPTQKN